MYARSPRMDTLQVPASRYAIKIQPMDVPMASDDDEECGLGYQNTLVSINNNEQYFELMKSQVKVFFKKYHFSLKQGNKNLYDVHI